MKRSKEKTDSIQQSLKNLKEAGFDTSKFEKQLEDKFADLKVREDFFREKRDSLHERVEKFGKLHKTRNSETGKLEWDSLTNKETMAQAIFNGANFDAEVQRLRALRGLEPKWLDWSAPSP